MRAAALAAAAALALAGPVAGAEPTVSLERLVPGDGRAVAVGDRVPLRAVVVVPPGYRVEEPRAAGGGDEVSLLSAGPAQGEALPGGGTRRSYPLELLVLALGEITFEGVAVPWTGPDGAAGVAVSDPVTLSAATAVPDPLQAEPADIRGPTDLPVPFRVPWWAWALAAAAAAAGGLIWWLRRRPAAPAPAPVAPDPFDGLGPADWALRELDALARGELLGREGVEAYHVRLSEILRRYLEGQFAIPALERTSAEILADVEARLRPLAATRSRLREVLAACDMVKFARLRPGGEEVLALPRQAARVVHETRPAGRPGAEAAS